MKLKFAWSERRTGQKLGQSSAPLVMSPVEDDLGFRKASNEVEDILDDIFDSSKNILFTADNIEPPDLPDNQHSGEQSAELRDETDTTDHHFSDFTQEVNIDDDLGSDNGTQEMEENEEEVFYEKPVRRKFTVAQPSAGLSGSVSHHLSELDRGLDELDDLLDGDANAENIVHYEEFDNDDTGVYEYD